MSLRGIIAVVALAAVAAAFGTATPGAARSAAAVEMAQAEAPHGTEQRELQPRYEPVPPEEKSWYNDSYLFGLTRSVAGTTMIPAAKLPLFLLTVPLDVALLPFAAIGGLFG